MSEDTTETATVDGLSSETARLHLDQGRYAIVLLVDTGSGPRFLKSIRRSEASLRPSRKQSKRKPKMYVVQTSWSLAGAMLYMPVNDARFTQAKRELDNDGRTYRAINVICVDSGTSAPSDQTS